MVQSVVINIKNTDVLKTGIAFSQGDKGAEAELQIFVKDDEAYVLNAEKAEISFKRADGHVVIGELTGSDGVYSYHFSGNELQSAGDAVATVTLTFSDGRISSGAFSFQVRYNPMFDKSIEAGPYIWQLEKIVENAKTYTEYLENLIAQLKPEVGSTVLTKADLLNDFSQTAAGLKAMDAAVGKRIWDNFGNYIPSEKIVNNLLATQAGNVLDATQGKVLGDKVAKMEQSITELNSEIIQSSGSAPAIKGNTCTITTIKIKAGHRYIILGKAATNAGNSSIMSCKIQVDSGIAKTTGGSDTRTTMESGGGCVNWMYAEPQTDSVIALRGYGYANIEYNYEGILLGLQLR